MILAITVFAILIFLVAFRATGLIAAAKTAVTTANGAMATIQDKTLDDLQKEKAVQAASIGLAKSFISIAIRSIILLALTFLPIWLASLIGLASIDDTLTFMARWDVIVGASVIVIAGIYLYRKIRP